MLKRHGTWGSGLLRSAMDWCKTTARRSWRFASRIAGRSRMVGRKNGFAVARPMNSSKTIQLDLAGGLEELKKFAEVMRIGDRVRVFCDDGVVEAEKISHTRFKMIYAVETTGFTQ